MNSLQAIKFLNGLGVLPRKRLALTLFLMIVGLVFDALSVLLIAPLIALATTVEGSTSGGGGQLLTRSQGRLQEAFELIGLHYDFITVGLAGILFVLMRMVIYYEQTLNGGIIKHIVARQLVMKFFNVWLEATRDAAEKLRKGDLVNLLDHQSQSVGMLLQSLLTSLIIGLTFAIYAVIMLLNDARMSIFALCAAGLVLLLMRGYNRKVQENSRRVIAFRSQYASYLAEVHAGWRDMKLNSNQKLESEKVKLFSRNFYSLSIFLIRLGGIMRLYIGVLLLLIGILTGLVGVFIFELDFESMALFLVVFLRLIPAAQQIGSARQTIVSYLPNVEHFRHELETLAASQEPLNTGKTFPGFRADIRFDKVTFLYAAAERPALDDVSLTIPVGKVTVIAGPSGAGKTTLLDCLTRLATPQSGQVLVDGVANTEFSLASYRGAIGYMSQHSFLVDSTIRDNVTFGRQDVDDDAIWRVLRQADCDRFVSALPQGLDAPAGENGSRLSGGQRQRLAIARVLLANPDLIILDEPTSSLDDASESEVISTIRNLAAQGTTVILISHRASTAAIADHVVTIQNGCVVDEKDTI